MPLTAQSIIQRAAGVLQDTTAVRWGADELTRWLNDGQREIVLQRPDSNTKTATATCAAGTRQNLTTMTGISGTNPAKLLDVTRNMASGSAKKAVRLVTREILDAQNPGWHNQTQAVDIVHYTYDPRDPLAFFTYPPATAAAQLEIVYSAYPTDVAVPAAGTDYTAVSGNISLPDIYGNALLDYILYRAYLKDAEYAGNAQRAQAHYMAFANSLGIEAKSLFGNSPWANTTFNPNAARAAAAPAA